MLHARFWEYTVQSLQTIHLPDTTLRWLHEIEQDMWARWLGEYLFCSTCQKVFSKSDIFDHWDISQELWAQRFETVAAIERILWDVPSCPCCGNNTEHVYGEDHYSTIERRHRNPNSFLTVAQNTQWEIIGLMDWFSAKLLDIYEQEFYAHFSAKVLDIIENKFWISPDTQVLTVSSLWMDEKHRDFGVTSDIIKNFTRSLYSKYDFMPVVVESIVASNTYAIFKIMGATAWNIPQDFSEVLLWNQKHSDHELDILFQADGIHRYKTNFAVHPRDLVKIRKAA